MKCFKELAKRGIFSNNSDKDTNVEKEEERLELDIKVLKSKETNQIAAVFYDTNVNKLENFICGKIYEITSWTDKGEALGLELFGHVSVKPDGCSHFAIEESDDIHLCGFDSYNDYFTLYIFAYALAFLEMKMCDTENGTNDHSKCTLLDNYTIENFHINDAINDYIGRELLEDNK